MNMQINTFISVVLKETTKGTTIYKQGGRKGGKHTEGGRGKIFLQMLIFAVGGKRKVKTLV